MEPTINNEIITTGCFKKAGEKAITMIKGMSIMPSILFTKKIIKR